MGQFDWDFPCNKIFVETDEQFARRKARMERLKLQLGEQSARYEALVAIVDQEQRLTSAAQEFCDVCYGSILDIEFKSVMNAKNNVEKRLEVHLREKSNMWSEMRDLRKVLSELSR